MVRWNALYTPAIAVFCLIAAVVQDEPGDASTNVAPQLGPHGGEVHSIDGYQYEVVFTSKCLRAYVFDSQGEPVETSNLRGRMTTQVEGTPRKHHYDLYPETSDGRPTNRLYLAMDFSDVADGHMSTRFTIHGLNRPAGRPAS